jgi:hypothetical protein
VCELAKVRFAVEVGVGVRRHAGLAAPGGGGRCEPASGEAAVRPDLCAALEAPEDPSEGG